MLSRDHLHSLILVPVGELMPRLDARSRSRLAWAITNRLHPTVVEQILRESEQACDLPIPAMMGGYSSGSKQKVGDGDADPE